MRSSGRPIVGRPHFATKQSGKVTLSSSGGPGARSLTLNSTFGNWPAYVTPVK
jgi:hypothetical protein